MESGAIKALDLDLYRRGQLVTSLSRWLSVGLAALSLTFVWEDPRTRPQAALTAVVAYAAFALAAQLLFRRRMHRAIKVAHDVVDALAVGFGSAFSGGLDGPVWLLLYPHVVAVSVRGGLTYALALGVLDAGIVTVLTFLTPQHPLGMLHALTLLFCAFMGGTTSSYLGSIQERLARVNRELQSKNERLQELLASEERARRDQETAVEMLKASEHRYRRLLEKIQDGVAIVVDGRIAYANEGFGALAGDAPEAFRGIDFRELVPPQDRQDLSERYQRWQQTQAVSGVLETRLLTRQGAVLTISLRAGSVEYEGRRAVIATLRDITRERRMEGDVKAHAERLAGINEIANAVNLSLTIEDIAAVLSKEALRLLPFDRLSLALLEDEGAQVEVVAPGATVARQRFALARPAASWAFRRPLSWCEGDPDEAPEHFAQVLPDGPLKAVASVPLLSKDRVIGSLNLARRKAVPFTSLDLAVMEPVARHIAVALDNARLLEAVRRRGREFESLLALVRHIGERLDLQELLPMVARSVNRVMGTQHCLLLLRDGERLRVVAQEGMEPEVVRAFRELRVGESLSGWVIQENRLLAVEDMRNDPRLMFSSLAQAHGYQSFLGVPLRRGAEVLGSLEVVTKDQTRRFGPDEQALMIAFADQAAIAIDNARLLEDARRHLQEVVSANRRLEDVDRLRREYLRNVSHEFRSPLTVIRGYAEFLRDQDEPADVRGVMGVVVESCDRVIDLVDTLIEVSRVEQEGAERTLQVQDLDLRELAESSVESLKTAADRKGVRVDVSFPRGTLAVQGDRGLLHHLVRKLVDNAVKYSPPGAQVVVSGHSEHDSATLEVQDTGIGIPPEHVPRIFEKFYMVDGGLTRRASGTGVGLYLVREIVRLHRGSVDVTSRPGEGSLFRVRLPRAVVRAALA